MNSKSTPENSYDVIIIGAGPGGLNCAKVLEKSDLKVLLIEKNETIGPKICAGGITTKDLDLLQIPKDVIDYSYNEIVFETPTISTRLTSEKTFICTIDRPKFGKWQFEQLKKTTVITNKRVKSVSKTSIELETGETINFKYLVGADGSNSIVRRFLGKKTDTVGIGIQYIIPKDDNSKSDLVLRFSNKEFSYFYGWIFPHKKFLSIGTVGLRGKSNFVKLRKALDSWIERLGFSLEGTHFESLIINSDDNPGCVFGNIFLLGDAAGLASVLTGEGIYSALISGEEIAKKIIDSSYEMPALARLNGLLDSHRQVFNTIRLSGILRQTLFDNVAKKLDNPLLAKKAIEKYC